jgi:hypothetical protein
MCVCTRAIWSLASSVGAELVWLCVCVHACYLVVGIICWYCIGKGVCESTRAIWSLASSVDTVLVRVCVRARVAGCWYYPYDSTKRSFVAGFSIYK